MSAIEDRIAALGITLTKPPVPAANYIPYRRSGRIVFISGQISSDANGPIRGKLGATMDVAAGQKAARAAAVNLLSNIRHSIGVPFDDVSAILRHFVMVNAAPDFTEPHLVANGASDLLVEVFGEVGRHARTAIGVATLPLGAAVEIEAVLELRA
jgi:enamine deaminase RidA (YjgF/YER057c/UK114 family)